MRLCSLGIHAYRTISVKSSGCPDIPGYRPSWDHKRKCKHCGWERTFLTWRYPRIRIDKERK